MRCERCGFEGDPGLGYIGFQNKIYEWCTACEPAGDISFLYLIQSGDSSLYKIGYSSNVFERVRTFQTASPHRLRVVYVVQASRDIICASETLLHRMFSASKTGGGEEWFDLGSRNLETAEGIFVAIGIRRGDHLPRDFHTMSIEDAYKTQQETP